METQQLLLMTLVNRDGAVTGKGRLSYLTDTGGDELTINGSRTPDSLFLTYQRTSQASFEFRGAYRGAGLAGILHGAEFDSLAILFRHP